MPETKRRSQSGRVMGLSPGAFAVSVILGTLGLGFLISILFCSGCCGALSLLPTPLPSATPTDTPVLTDTPLLIPSSRPTREPTSIPTLKLSATSTRTPTASPTPTSTPTDTPIPTDTLTPTPERTLARVVEVVDGDTIHVEIGGETYSVRYIGIDCPETVHPTEPVGWMGPEASEANRNLVEGKTVYLEKDVSETDKYGRLLRYVFLDNGTFVNAELVRLGYAQVSTYPPDVKYQDLFLEMQEEAREAGRGLWGPTPTPLPVPPTATPAPTSPPPAPTLPPAAPGEVKITYVYYDGVVPRVESDEYAVIKNTGGTAVNLGGWRLNAGDEGQDFWFPSYELGPGQECRVYTNESHPESGGFSFGSGKALWNNKGDCGHLYNADGVEVSTYCY
jgi:endonuclease YncB( thermonuclease family)